MPKKSVRDVRDNLEVLLLAQLFEALRYKPEVRGFDYRFCQRNFSLT
jgi:hypothetical protein